MSNSRYPEFLTADDEPHRRVRCPIHGFIRFSENERRIIDNPLFQRLRFIRQLALTEYLYPGANHTRFEHSLGVMDVVTRAFDSLAQRHGARMADSFQEVSDFKDKPLALARQFVRLAALLHDIGHASFSHAAEGVVHKTGHENLSIRVVLEPEYLGDGLINLYSENCPQWVARIIEGGHDLPPQLQVLHDLISGEMDADRTDYLIRDSYHCGVEYGRFDYRRLIDCLDLYEGDFGTLEIALHKDGIHAFEALILARYQMNTQVYYHRLRRIYDLYLTKYHEALAEEVAFTDGDIIGNNDITMTARIIQDAKNEDSEKGRWAARIINRKHHRLVFETGVNARATEIKMAKKLFSEVETRYNIGPLFDIAQGRIHKLLRDDDADARGFVELRLTGSSNPPRLVGGESQVLSRIPREFQCVRIFGDFEREDSEERRNVQAEIQTIWRDLGGS